MPHLTFRWPHAVALAAAFGCSACIFEPAEPGAPRPTDTGFENTADAGEPDDAGGPSDAGTDPDGPRVIGVTISGGGGQVSTPSGQTLTVRFGPAVVTPTPSKVRKVAFCRSVAKEFHREIHRPRGRPGRVYSPRHRSGSAQRRPVAHPGHAHRDRWQRPGRAGRHHRSFVR